MHLTSHYELLTRNMNGPGVLVHTATRDESVTIVVHKCGNFDTNDFEVVTNDEYVTFRVQVGNQNLGLTKRVAVTENVVTFTDLPIKCGEEIWVASSMVNKYCVYGYTKRMSK